jgi:hypothetical protein
MTKPPSGVLEEEEEEKSLGMLKEDEPSPTSARSHPMKPPPGARKKERCGGD